jgi:hypothetical protein
MTRASGITLQIIVASIFASAMFFFSPAVSHAKPKIWVIVSANTGAREGVAKFTDKSECEKDAAPIGSRAERFNCVPY